MKLKVILSLILYTGFFASCNSQPKDGATQSPKDTVYTFRSASMDGIGKFYQGREISHVMGAAGSDWLEREERQQEENANLAIEKITLPANGSVADIGAGTGYYSFRLSDKVPQGKVYAVEIQDELIELLQKKKASLKDSIVEVVRSTSKSIQLPDNSIDLAIMVDVYHELEFPAEILQSIRKALKTKGKILLIEYRGEDPAVPIKPLHKTTVFQLGRELLANGFTLSFKGDFLPIQHFLLYEKN